MKEVRAAEGRGGDAGVTACEPGGRWVRTPKHMLRWSCVADRTRDWEPGSFLELGAGTGDFTRGFLLRGFHGTCYDLSRENRQLLRRNLVDFGSRVRVVDSLAELAGRSFSHVLAFEVLEHIEDDRGALATWLGHLEPAGRLLLSVPAHMRKFGADDRFVGHIRRYEVAELRRLLEGLGLEEVRVVNYGFPLGNLTRVVNDAMARPEPGVEGLSRADRSMSSGSRRSRAVLRLAPLFRSGLVQPFAWLQRLFYGRDWGDGYVVTARKTLGRADS